jgi:NAD(P)-dependent dehydrogenase (short-subunit alcohol dehydrogenase family)
MSRILITGSVDGIGRATAESLIRDGHAVVLHARSSERAESLGDLRDQAAGVVVGDLSRAADVRAIANRVNELGRMDAVVHNAGVYMEHERSNTPEGHARTFAINTLAPYLLTALIDPPTRLVYLSSGLHRSATDALDDVDWRSRRWDAAQAYAESKLHVATLAAALARIWPSVFTASVDPGWVRTKMGGPSAPSGLADGSRTQVRLAGGEPSGDDSGRYWHHESPREPHPAAVDRSYQDALLDALAEITGERLPEPV